MIALGLLVLATLAGWLHNSHLAIEVMARFAVLGFLFGALQLSAFGTQVIPLNETVVLIFFLGGLWTISLLAVEQRWFPSHPATPPVELWQGWQRIRLGQTAGLRFACCYGLVATIAFVGSLLLHLPRPFWTTATTLVVMKPDSRATVQRTVQRIVGTLMGVLVVEGIITWTDAPLLLIGWILLVAPLIPIGIARNYTLCCVAITVLVMVLIDLLTLQQGGDRALLPVRFVATLVGSLLTVMGTAITYPNLWRGQE